MTNPISNLLAPMTATSCQAIETKYVSATNTRGSRVKASAQAGSVVISWDDSLNTDENHAMAALALAKKFGWLDGHAMADPLKELPAPEIFACTWAMGASAAGTGRVFVRCNVRADFMRGVDLAVSAAKRARKAG